MTRWCVACVVIRWCNACGCVDAGFRGLGGFAVRREIYVSLHCAGAMPESVLKFFFSFLLSGRDRHDDYIYEYITLYNKCNIGVRAK